MRSPAFALLITACAAGFSGAGCLTRSTPPAGGLACGDLTCEAIADPLGIDAAQPRLGWMLSSPGRGQAQTAYEIVAASAPGLLESGTADRWQSGKVSSDATTGIAYAGAALHSFERVYWKVRVWDGNGTRSDWSAPASWTMGMIGPGAWRAAWITDPELLRLRRTFFGYRSTSVADPDTTKWVQLDLGSSQPVDEIRLDGVRSGDIEGLGFPRRFKVELSEDPHFRSATVVADQTQADLPNRWIIHLVFPARQAAGRYVRLTATRLRVEEGAACLALSRIEVLSEGRHLDVGAAVTASDSAESGSWSTAALADGRGGPRANPRANTTLLLRREFAVRPGLRRALASWCGLGGCTLELNGARVGEEVLSPGWTDYARTCLYQSHDVTRALRPGLNAAGLSLVGGMYDVEDGRYTKFVTPVRPLTAIAEIRLEYADGSVETVMTDRAWRQAQGPITFAHVYGGEDYDARLEPHGWTSPGFDDRRWAPVALWEGPGGTLRGASFAAPPLRRFEVMKPVAMARVRPGVEVYDLGQNAAMMLQLSVRGPAGSSVRVIPAELLAPDGSVDPRSGGAGSWWQYTLAGQGEESWAPDYFYHGCRYLQVERRAADGGDASALPAVVAIAGVLVHSASPPVGEFSSSNELFNRTRAIVRWAQQSNMVSVLTDCPHREKLGWLEEDHLNGPALRYEFGLNRLFAKITGDMADAQLANGLVPDIAPEYIRFTGGFRDSPEWGSSCILVPWQQYEWTGDLELLRRARAMMKRYLAYLGTKASGHILAYGLGDWDDIGPGPGGISQLTPVALTATAIYAEDARIFSRVSELLGYPEDARTYGRLAGEIRAAFNRTFFQPATARYATASQCAQAMPLALGLVEPARRAAVLEALITDMNAQGGSLTAGDVGYRYLLRALADGNRSDVIAAMIDQSDRPGYGYQLAHGATSLIESWTASRHASQDHFMLGQITEWFYHDLAGIQDDPAGPGFKRIIIHPAMVADVTWVKARFASVRGPIGCAWTRQAARFSLRLSIPANTTATVYVPTADPASVTEGGRPARTAPGVRFLRAEGGFAVFAIGSGEYGFAAAAPAAPIVAAR